MPCLNVGAHAGPVSFDCREGSWPRTVLVLASGEPESAAEASLPAESRGTGRADIVRTRCLLVFPGRPPSRYGRDNKAAYSLSDLPHGSCLQNPDCVAPLVLGRPRFCAGAAALHVLPTHDSTGSQRATSLAVCGAGAKHPGAAYVSRV
jgi:hypothetical protein